MFRDRLNEAMQSQWLNRSTLAERAGVDRSTVSLLLSEQQTRLPSGHVVADLAAALNVTTDWLLGLTTTTRAPGEILRESLQVAERAPGRNDANIERWLQEAGDAKVRNVPATLARVHENRSGDDAGIRRLRGQIASAGVGGNPGAAHHQPHARERRRSGVAAPAPGGLCPPRRHLGGPEY